MRRLSALALSACVSCLASACSPGEAPARSRLEVVATTGMIADAVRAIVGRPGDGEATPKASVPGVHVEGLMGPGVDPHLYSASREDQRRLASADLVLYHGLHLEGKMTELIDELRSRARAGQRIEAVAEVIPTERLFRNEAFAQYPDPHVWFDLGLWELVVARVASTLTARDPDHAAIYAANLELHQAELREAHEWAKKEIERIPERWRRLVTSHDAYNYFGRAYGIEVHGLQGISTDTQAGLDEIRRAVLFIREHQLPVIFAETSVPHTAIEQVARESGAKVCPHELFSDALGANGTPEETLLGVFRHNVRTIVDALRGETARP